MLHDNAQVAAILVAVLFVLVMAQRRLSWRAKWPESLRQAVWPVGDKLVGKWRPFMRDKTESGEYVCTVSCSRRQLQKALYDYGYRWNLLSTLKYVVTRDGSTSVEELSWAFRTSLRAQFMFHGYGFLAAEPGFTFHLHQHVEENYLHDPAGHTSGFRRPSQNNLLDALREADIDRTFLEDPEYHAD